MDEKEKKSDLSADNPVKPSTPVVTPGKTPRYKQCYRLEWESMPDFKGWLRGVPNEPTRAYCIYCDKSLHAHRLSLLKHTCTLKHTRAAQDAFAVKKNTTNELQPDVKMPQLKAPNHTSKNDMHDDDDEDEEAVDDVEAVESHYGGESDADTNPPVNKVPRIEAPVPPSSASPLSTHVLDTAKGNPVGGLQVSLYRLIDGRWTLIHEGFTNPDGRYTDFIQKADFVAGRYKLHFDVDRYFELRRQESLYPFIEIAFDVKSPQDHYHIPLLLSPFGYTTYRGS